MDEASIPHTLREDDYSRMTLRELRGLEARLDVFAEAHSYALAQPNGGVMMDDEVCSTWVPVR